MIGYLGIVCCVVSLNRTFRGTLQVVERQYVVFNIYGTTNYRIGPHRTTSDRIGRHRTASDRIGPLGTQKMRVNWGSRQA